MGMIRVVHWHCLSLINLLMTKYLFKRYIFKGKVFINMFCTVEFGNKCLNSVMLLATLMFPCHAEISTSFHPLTCSKSSNFIIVGDDCSLMY